jgi:hypothetical protein
MRVKVDNYKQRPQNTSRDVKMPCKEIQNESKKLFPTTVCKGIHIHLGYAPTKHQQKNKIPTSSLLPPLPFLISCSITNPT